MVWAIEVRERLCVRLVLDEFLNTSVLWHVSGESQDERTTAYWLGAKNVVAIQFEDEV